MVEVQVPVAERVDDRPGRESLVPTAAITSAAAAARDVAELRVRMRDRRRRARPAVGVLAPFFTWRLATCRSCRGRADRDPPTESTMFTNRRSRSRRSGRCGCRCSTVDQQLRRRTRSGVDLGGAVPGIGTTESRGIDMVSRPAAEVWPDVSVRWPAALPCGASCAARGRALARVAPDEEVVGAACRRVGAAGNASIFSPWTRRRTGRRPGRPARARRAVEPGGRPAPGTGPDAGNPRRRRRLDGGGGTGRQSGTAGSRGRRGGGRGRAVRPADAARSASPGSRRVAVGAARGGWHRRAPTRTRRRGACRPASGRTASRRT